MTRARTLTLVEHVEERERVRRHNRLVRGGCGIIALACVALAGVVVLPGIQEQRRELQLINPRAHFEDMPPSVTLPAAMLSTFRGLAIHVLVARGEKLKEEGKYYELQQLSDWICQMQPRYPKVWENASWNMSYNISVGTFSPRERWHWVSAGAYLLRDLGLKYNPKTINMYYQLAWIYLHKMGDFMDDHHRDYKRNVATALERTLGQPPPDLDGQAVIAAIRAIAEAAEAISELGPLGNDEFLQMYIARDGAEPSMAEFGARLAELGFEPNDAFLEYVARYHRRDLGLEDLLLGTAEDQRRQELRALMGDARLAPARDRYLAAVRAHVLKRVHKLDAPFMLELMERFGPLDWRSVYAHGLYWAAMGVRECKDVIGLDENVEMNTNRYVQFGIKDTCERGRIILEPDFDDAFKSFIDLLPDSRFIDQLHELYLQQAEALRGDEDPAKYYREGPAGRLFKSGHVNFLHQSVRTLFLEGLRQRAQFYYDYLRENYREPDGSTKEQYLEPLDDFVMQDYFEDVDSFKTGPVIIHTMLEGCFLNLAYERRQAAAMRYQLAETAYEKYMGSKTMDRTERRKLPPWPQVRADAFQRFMMAYRRLGPLPKEVVMKARVWKAMSGISEDTLLRTYRMIEQSLRPELATHEPPLDFDKAFPAPPGLAEFEEQQRREGQEPTGSDAADELEVREGTKR